MAKLVISIYQLDVVSDFVVGCRILVSINIYLTPMYRQYPSVSQNFLDQPNSAKTPFKRIGQLTEIPKPTDR